MKQKQLFIAFIISLALMIPLSGYSTELSGFAGAFEDIGLGLRPLAMGGAYSALAADENAARWNPAMLAGVDDPIAGFTWTNQYSLIPYNYLSTSIPVPNVLGVREDLYLGGYFVSAGDEVFRETTCGIGVGFKGPQIHIPLPNLKVGATVKLMFTNFGNDEEGGENRTTGSSFGYGLDLGAHYQVIENAALSVVFGNLINNMNWDSSVKGSYSEGLPRTLTLGASLVKNNITMAFEMKPGLYADVKDRMAVGAEVVIWKVLKPRVGFARNFSASNPNQWTTAGLGIEIKPKQFGPIRLIHFGYTQMFHEIDSSPRVGLVIGW